MQQVMKRMGIQQQEIDAVEVIIRTEDREIVISNPSVAKVNMMGQETFQVSGNAEERELPSSNESVAEISDDDIKTVASQANASEEEAKRALEASNGDIAAAILSLKQD